MLARIDQKNLNEAHYLVRTYCDETARLAKIFESPYYTQAMAALAHTFYFLQALDHPGVFTLPGVSIENIAGDCVVTLSVKHLLSNMAIPPGQPNFETFELMGENSIELRFFYDTPYCVKYLDELTVRWANGQTTYLTYEAPKILPDGTPYDFHNTFLAQFDLLFQTKHLEHVHDLIDAVFMTKYDMAWPEHKQLLASFEDKKEVVAQPVQTPKSNYKVLSSCDKIELMSYEQHDESLIYHLPIVQVLESTIETIGEVAQEPKDNSALPDWVSAIAKRAAEGRVFSELFNHPDSQHIQDLTNQARISPEMAINLATVCGTFIEFYIKEFEDYRVLFGKFKPQGMLLELLKKDPNQPLRAYYHGLGMHSDGHREMTELVAVHVALMFPPIQDPDNYIPELDKLLYVLEPSYYPQVRKTIEQNPKIGQRIYLVAPPCEDICLTGGAVWTRLEYLAGGCAIVKPYPQQKQGKSFVIGFNPYYETDDNKPFFMLLNMMPKAQKKLTRQLERLVAAREGTIVLSEDQPRTIVQSAKTGGYTVIYNQHAKLLVNWFGPLVEKPFLDLPLGSIGFLMQEGSETAAPVRLLYTDVLQTGIEPYFSIQGEISEFAFGIVIHQDTLPPGWFNDYKCDYIGYCHVLVNDDYIFETTVGSKVKSLIHLPTGTIGTFVRSGADGRAAVKLVSTSAHHTFVKPTSAAAKNPHPTMGFTIYPKEDKVPDQHQGGDETTS